MAEESNKFSGKGCLVIITLILFMINTIKFINVPASEVPVLSILFNMILYLWIIIFILHKKKINTFSCKMINIIIKNDILKIIRN